MSDTEQTPTPPEGSEPPRDATSGKYVRRHGTDDKEGTPGEVPEKDKEKDGKKRWLLLLLLLLILALLVCAGFAYNIWWGKKDPDPVAASPSPSVTATAAQSPSPSPATSPSPSPSPTPTVKTINMPDVVGMPAQDAKVILEGAGFTSIKFVTEATPNEEQKVLVSLVVTKQSVTAGSAVPADTALVITCKTVSNGKG